MTATDTTKASELIRVEVVYCASHGTGTQSVSIPLGATLREAIERSRLMERFSEIDLAQAKVGVYGTIKSLAAEARPGDRIEIYRPITCDPETVPRRDIPPEA